MEKGGRRGLGKVGIVGIVGIVKTILLVSPYWKEKHRWMVSSVKLAELWQRLGYRVVVVCMGGGVGERCAFARCAFLERPSPSLALYRKKDVFLPDPWNYGIAIGFAGFVHKVIQEEKPDIIVCNKILFWSSLAVIPLCLRGYRVILLTDALVGMTWWGRTPAFRLASRIYAWTLGWLIMLCAKRIIFFHPQPEKLLRRLWVWKKSQVIPTGIDPTPYSLLPTPFHTDTVVTYIGRLESVKGADDFVEAVVPLKRDFPNLTVQVVGWYKEGHSLVAKYKDRVVFTGLRDDIPAILATTDIFVMPSYSEGLSNAIMEAMASSCACVVSDVGGNRFLIQNGISGFLFPPGDREVLKAHVRRLIEDPIKRRALGQAARKRIEEGFSWEKVGEEYRRLFEEFLSCSGGSRTSAMV